MTDGFLRSVSLTRDEVPSFDEYPFSIPAARSLDVLAFDPRVTFLIGANGSGKSTLIEAIAMTVGFNPESGSKNFNFATARSESVLHEYLRLVRNPKTMKTGFFLRAESFFNVATALDNMPKGAGNPLAAYGGKSLHKQSHGESFLSLANNRFGPEGLYILDEPEAALSPTSQLAFLSVMHRLAKQDCQFIIATHSPILMAYPEALIYVLSGDGIEAVEYEQTEHFQTYRDFLASPGAFFRHLFADDEDE